MPANDLNALVGRTEQLVTAISDAILSAAEAAAERVELAAEVARVQQRLAAFSAVVESIAVQKRVLVERLATADGPAKALLERQVELLGLQELAVLERAGVPQATAQHALAAVDAASALLSAESTNKTYRRDGKRFVRVAAATDASRNGSTAARE
jgi:acetolactate synthase small subunit